MTMHCFYLKNPPPQKKKNQAYQLRVDVSSFSAPINLLYCRVARSPQEGEKPWWCDPAQPGYAFILNEGVKTWCEENA